MANASWIPSAADLLLVVPRLAQRAGSYAFFHMPEMDSIASKLWSGGSVIADATGQQTANSTITNTSAFVQSTAAVLDAAIRESWQDSADETTSLLGLMAQGIGKLKNFGGIFSYLTSKWALATFAIAIILNRVSFYASSRQNLRLQWYMRLALYIIPIASFLVQMQIILQALRCQTSPNFPQLRYGDPLKSLAIDFAAEGGFLYKLSSTLLFWQDDAASCAARSMSLTALKGNKSALRGSMSLLFRFFLTLCTSQLFETLCCALQGKQPVPETGMTIFEHSLAFAECEAMISSALGFGLFGLPKLDSAGEATGLLLSRAEILQRLNVPPEVLLVCLISCFSHISSATLAILGLRDKVRLINTGIWACCYMSSFAWSFAKVVSRPVTSATDLGVLRFPTVCVVGFIPHLLILVGTAVCGTIYGVALLVTAMSVPEDIAEGMSFTQRFAWAYQNLQANVQFSATSSITIKMSEDFYTTLLKVGFNVLTAASEAVYLNEGSKIKVAQMTWLEQKRIDELGTSLEKRRIPAVPGELLGDGIAQGLDFVDSQNHAIGYSPYARERKSQSMKGRHPDVAGNDNGLGISQRRNRMQLTFDFLAGIFWLVTSVQAQILLRVLDRLGIEHRPAWLLKAAGTTEVQRRPSLNIARTRGEKRDFWMVGPNGHLMLPKNDNVDVEAETRKRLQRAGNYVGEESLSEQMYDWWRGGGWFGTADLSGEYEEGNIDDDVTSMVSMSTNASTTGDDDDDDDEDESGRRTPTRLNPYGDREDTPTADGVLDMTVLSRLLNPQSAAEREEARLLSYSLQSSRPMTRSQYRRNTDRSRAQLLTGLRDAHRPSSEAEEEEDLEQFILAQRSKAKSKAARAGATWESGAEESNRIPAGLANFNLQHVTSRCLSFLFQINNTPHLRASIRLNQNPGSVRDDHLITYQSFMQPEPSTANPTASSNSPTERDIDTRKHGLHAHEPAVPVSPAIHDAGTGRAISSEEQLALDEAFARSLQDTREPPRQVGRLSTPPRSTPSPPAVNRISEYEQASTPPVRRREGPGFEVIKKQRSPNDKRSPIQELPNEVLTHALAHLSPTDLTSVASVSKRFHDLVTGPHAWRSAFAHFFPGASTLDPALLDDDDEAQDVVRSEKRAFTRLTALASWRSEYIMRTRLLRSLGRGKPVQAIAAPNAARSGQSHTAKPFVEYNAQLYTTINHLHATFGTGLNKKPPRLVHGADDVGAATSSDPSTGKVDNWGLSDPQQFLQFAERFPGDSQYGLGPGDVVGVPNVMDVSQPYGMIHGEGSPGGMVYYRSTDEMRGRFLLFSSAMSMPELGIPRISSTNEAVTAVWIAKSNTLPSLTDGLVGMLSGSSQGVLTAYSLGATISGNVREQRFGRGEMTARWALSPGVPIVGIAVDPEHSLNRQAQNRIWAVVLNALGEVFYITKFPKRPHVERGMKLDNQGLERMAWLTGRSVHWNLVEASRRSARPDPYAQTRIDGSYSPRSSWTGMCLGVEQVKAETREIEAFAARKPKDFRKACLGWDMRRKLEVDFAGDDGSNAGENVVVIDCGLDEETSASIKRYTRCRYREGKTIDAPSTPPLTSASTDSSSPPSLFGSPSHPVTAPIPGFSLDRLDDALSHDDLAGSITPRPMSEEWRASTYSLGGLKSVQILATTLDSSTFATQTISEDPLLSFSGRSAASSPSMTPVSMSYPVVEPVDMPGQRARLFAVGTKTGIVLVWNMRVPPPKTATTLGVSEPVRIIYTESPQISCLAMSSLFLIHGGNDGLVQAWDPLGSSLSPIRTLSSRFASRARRQLAQAQASPQGVGINLFAAGALCLDPDPTVLRGMVSLGVRLLHWSYSSSAADQYKSQKRRLRRTERGSNNGGAQFSGAARSNLKDYIANEKFELDREKQNRKKEAQHFAGRFGTEMMSEEEMLAYAAMLSEETLQQETTMRRSSDTSTAVGIEDSAIATGNVTPSGSLSPPTLATPKSDEELDADVAEAIRQSLATSPTVSAYDIPIRQAKRKGRKASSAKPSPQVSPDLGGSSKAAEMSDLEFAMQLSLAEEQSKRESAEIFPALAPRDNNGGGKGKRRQS
ncbi:hypothetical protein LTR56_019272 [Elasticomyces elasticus]|nr:hypothetical protein LTR22_023185 [Elasticomyces elasticus]KAK3627357.1 hypothetical protein LTR56_019272 [Elasticomyces elasticus]KAK4911429.1 hypothetical protein LTR49_020001 [Elasticomyces elasticus]